MTSSPELGVPSDVLAGSGGDDLCSEIDALLAARAEGTIDEAGASRLERHLASCALCREVAETLSPAADRDGDHAQLPSVDPGAYELGLEIARGGMGRVLAARDLRVGRPVAVKELLGRNAQLAARFEREARVTARLQHPGILPIYEIGRWPDGTPFYTMRMVEGERLFDAIASAPTLAARLALLPAVIAASEAVAFAHGQRVIHRDLTPANILVGAYGETVVIDWGLAKDLGALDDTDALDDNVSADGSGDKLTAVGAVIGTPSYMPPEQAHAQPVDERADVYALGAILYHLLAGVAPYRGSSSRELLRAVRTGPPPPLGDVVTGVPRELVSIADKAMARDPAARYPTARELAEELKRFQTGRLVEAHAYSGADRISRILKRHKGVVSVAAFAAVLLGAMAIISVTRVLESRAEARRQVRELLVEEARVELLAGFPLRALAFLDEAAAQGTDSPSLAFLRDAAIASVPESERVLDCGDDVRWVEASPDGTRIVAACRNRARLWAANGGLLYTLEAPHGFNKIVFSADGRELLSWGDGHEARVWDGATGKLRAVLDHGSGINDAELTADNARAVTIGQDGTAKVWRVATQTRERTIVAKQTGMLWLFGRISRDGTQVLTVSMEGEGRGWSIDTGELVGGFDHGGGALLLGGDYSLDGAHSSTCGTDRLAKVWNMKTGAQVAVLGGNTDVVWKCVFSHDGSQLLTSSHDGRVTIWNFATGAAVSSVMHGDVVLWARFSPDGRRILTVGVDGVIKLWDARSGASLGTLDTRSGKDAHFSADGTRLYTQRGDGRIEIWKMPVARQTYVRVAGERVLGVGNGARRLVVADGSGAVTLRDLASGTPASPVTLREPAALSTSGNRVAAISAEGDIAVLDVATGAMIVRLPVRGATRLQLSETGARLLVVRPDASPEVWDVAAARRAGVIDGARDAALGRGGERALGWTSGGAPFVWDVEGQTAIATIAPDPHGLEVIGFSAGDRRVVVSSSTGRTRAVTVWDTATGARIGEPLVDTSVGAALDPTGANVTTIDADSVIAVTSLEDGATLTSFVLDQALGAQANHDGTLIAALGDNGTSVEVVSADGRPLLRSPIEHGAPSVAVDGFRAAEGLVRWAGDDAIVSTSATVVRTPLRSLRARPEVPWRVVGGRLVPIDKVKLRGRVTVGGAAPGRATIRIEVRTVSGHGPAVDYESRAVQATQTPVVLDADGDFELPELVAPGDYRFVFGDREATVHVGVDGAPVDVVL